MLFYALRSSRATRLTSRQEKGAPLPIFNALKRKARRSMTHEVEYGRGQSTLLMEYFTIT